jgi:hypothetical protein
MDDGGYFYVEVTHVNLYGLVKQHFGHAMKL